MAILDGGGWDDYEDEVLLDGATPRFVPPRSQPRPRTLIDGARKVADSLSDLITFTPAPKKEELLDRIRERTRNSDVPGVNDLESLARVVENTSPISPVYKVDKALMQNGALQVIFGNEGPNLIKTTSGRNIGPHFDEYRRVGSPWTTWRSVQGAGVLRATFLSDELFAEYNQLSADLEPDQLGESLQRARAEIGVRAMEAATEVFTERFHSGDMFILWHGSLEERAANPGVHDIVRDEKEGAYEIFARTDIEDLGPSGFIRLR